MGRTTMTEYEQAEDHLQQRLFPWDIQFQDGCVFQLVSKKTNQVNIIVYETQIEVVQGVFSSTMLDTIREAKQTFLDTLEEIKHEEYITRQNI